jgi:hypothetical protein
MPSKREKTKGKERRRETHRYDGLASLAGFLDISACLFTQWRMIVLTRIILRSANALRFVFVFMFVFLFVFVFVLCLYSCLHSCLYSCLYVCVSLHSVADDSAHEDDLALSKRPMICSYHRIVPHFGCFERRLAYILLVQAVKIEIM